jgi:hypothetical protein
MRDYMIDLTRATDFEGFVAAFNAGFCRHHGEHWHGRSWDAFEDLLYTALGEEAQWPIARVRLRFRGWAGSAGLNAQDRKIIGEIIARIPQIEMVCEQVGRNR